MANRDDTEGPKSTLALFPMRTQALQTMLELEGLAMKTQLEVEDVT